MRPNRRLRQYSADISKQLSFWKTSTGTLVRNIPSKSIGKTGKWIFHTPPESFVWRSSGSSDAQPARAKQVGSTTKCPHKERDKKKQTIPRGPIPNEKPGQGGLTGHVAAPVGVEADGGLAERGALEAGDAPQQLQCRAGIVVRAGRRMTCRRLTEPLQRKLKKVSSVCTTRIGSSRVCAGISAHQTTFRTRPYECWFVCHGVAVKHTWNTLAERVADGQFETLLRLIKSH